MCCLPINQNNEGKEITGILIGQRTDEKGRDYLVILSNGESIDFHVSGINISNFYFENRYKSCVKKQCKFCNQSTWVFNQNLAGNEQVFVCSKCLILFIKGKKDALSLCSPREEQGTPYIKGWTYGYEKVMKDYHSDKR